MNEDQVHLGQRVVTNNGRWGTVIGRTCCYYHNDGKEHGAMVACQYWDGWWEVVEDGHGQVMQNAERLALHGIRMWDGSYLPEYDDPNPLTDSYPPSRNEGDQA